MTDFNVIRGRVNLFAPDSKRQMGKNFMRGEARSIQSVILKGGDARFSGDATVSNSWPQLPH